MKYLAAIAILFTGLFSGYFYANYRANKAAEDNAIVNILHSGVVTPIFLERQNYSMVMTMSAINTASNLDIAIDKNGSNTDKEFIMSKTRAFNALYLNWEKSQPSYINELTEPETKEWTIERYKRQMSFLKQFHEACLKDKELQCKDS